MLYKIHEISRLWNLPRGEVLHVGAHAAEELESYFENELFPITWVEAQPELAQNLARKLNPEQNRVLNVAAWDTNGEIKKLYVTNNSQSTSLLKMGTHLNMYPQIQVVTEILVETKRLDTLIPEDTVFTFINIDVQGAELEVLKGLGNLLYKTNVVYCEVNRKRLYENCAQVRELDKYLKSYGFKRVSTKWYLRAGWGDAVYTRNYRFNLRKWSLARKYEIIFYLPQSKSLILKIYRMLIGR